MGTAHPPAREFEMATRQRLHEDADSLESLHCVVEADEYERRLVVHHDDDMAEQVRRSSSSSIPLPP
jgi:hypothetical protein